MHFPIGFGKWIVNGFSKNASGNKNFAGRTKSLLTRIYQNIIVKSTTLKSHYEQEVVMVNRAAGANRTWMSVLV